MNFQRIRSMSVWLSLPREIKNLEANKAVLTMLIHLYYSQELRSLVEMDGSLP